MRPLFAALVLALAPIATAQTPAPSPAFTPETGLYAEVGAGGGYGTSLGVIAVGGAAVGYRLPNGIAAGVHARSSTVGGDHAALAFGPEVRYAMPLDARTTLDLHASGAVGLYSGPVFESAGLRATGIGAQVGGAATRRYDLGRGVTFAATGGLFGGVTQTFEADLAPAFGGDRAAGLGAYGGVVVGAQIEVNVLGGRLAIGPSGYIPLVSTGGDHLGYGTGIHRAGGGPSRGFITFTF